MASSKIYVAGAEVGRQIQKEDLEDKFRTFGTISSVWVARQPPGFAFIEFEDPRDAEDAMREMNNKEILGSTVRVEESRNNRQGGGGGGGVGGGDGNNDVKPGDWLCDSCGANNFARRLECFRCNAPKPRGGGGGGDRDDRSGRNDRYDRYDDRRDGGRGYRDDYRGGGGGGRYREDGASIMHAVLCILFMGGFLFDAFVVFISGGLTFGIISSMLLTFLPFDRRSACAP